MKNVETKCHRFWLSNLNPITMKKDDNELSLANLSKETMILRGRSPRNIGDKFNFNNQ